MIDLYTWNTPNGRKISIMLEEIGLPYRVHGVDISKNEQFAESFLRISPNNKIPAIVDQERGQSVFESGAILIYLAERSGQLMPKDEGRWQVLEWLMWQMSGLGPNLGQAHHYLKYNVGKAPYSEERFFAEAKRLYGVLNDRLKGREFIVGEYSIADIACWPWVSRFEWQRMDLHQYPHVRDWYQRIAQRPAVQRGYHVPAKVNDIPMP